jgi:hypothetical protein
MKKTLLLLTAVLASVSAFGQTKSVLKNTTGNTITESLKFPSGKTLTISAGATLDATGATLVGITGGSGAWADITGKPDFATVATSGAYADLSGLPGLQDIISVNSRGDGMTADVFGTPTQVFANDDGTHFFNSSGYANNAVSANQANYATMGYGFNAFFHPNGNTSYISLNEDGSASFANSGFTINTSGQVIAGTWFGSPLALSKIAQGGATSGQVMSWNGSVWAPATPVSVTWGNIGGTLSSQTDLNAALGAKESALTFNGGLSRATNTVSIATGGVTNTMLAGSIAASKVTGTAITAADTGTVTNAMLAGSIAASKVTGTAITAADTGTVTNAMLAGSIAASKVTGTAITAADTGTVTNAMLAGSIAASKVTGTAITAADTGTVTNTMLAGSIATNKITGLATSATTDTTNAANISSGTLPAARMPALTGAITTTAGTVATSLSATTVTAGSYGSATAVPTFTVGADGRLSAAANVTITGLAASSITGTAITAADTGTVTNAMLAGSIATSKITGTAITAADTGTVTNTMLAGSIATSKITGTAITAADTGTVTNAMLAGSIATGKITGLATSATTDTTNAANISSGTLLAARMPALTGDITSTAGAVATTLATVNANVGSFGTATAAPTFTVNAKGLLTAAGSVTITPAIGSITGLGTGIATALGINVGTAGAPVINGGALGTPSSGTVTNLTGTASININGTVGATTPTTGAFTNLTASSVKPAADSITAFRIFASNGATNLFNVDSTNSRIGIGTASPSAAVHVATTAASSIAAIRLDCGSGGYAGFQMYDGNVGNSWAVGHEYAAASNAKLVFAYGSVGTEITKVSITPTGLINCAGVATTSTSTFGGDVQLTKTITATGTTGAQTINKSSGSVNFAAGATSLVVTNSLVTTSSVIICTVGTNDTSMKSVSVVAGAGSFTIYANAAPTAETRVNFIIIN